MTIKKFRKICQSVGIQRNEFIKTIASLRTKHCISNKAVADFIRFKNDFDIAYKENLRACCNKKAIEILNKLCKAEYEIEKYLILTSQKSY